MIDVAIALTYVFQIGGLGLAGLVVYGLGRGWFA